MKRDTLLDYFDERVRGDTEFLVHDDGYRVRRHSYDEVRRAAAAFAARLAGAGIGAGDAVLFWGENRPEWIVGFWGCLLRGAVVVPIDYRASPAFLESIARRVDARLLLVGDDVAPAGLDGVETWRFADLRAPAADAGAPPPAPHAPAPGDTAEIVFTSGATSGAQGRRHHPPERARQHRPGRARGARVPPLRASLPAPALPRPAAPEPHVRAGPGHVHPPDAARHVRVHEGVQPAGHRAAGSHPAHLGPRLRAEDPRRAEGPREAGRPGDGRAAPEGLGVAHRWWRYRRVHRLFGLKFWCFIVGAAPLDPDLEAFWQRLGFLVVQGYGLTETAPIVTLNHPFRTRRGSVGKPIAGMQVRIADDGEILVKGDNVTTGYFGAGAKDDAAFEDGWFHTGDLGALDDTGRLQVHGRKKEMIVTAEGLNVFPEDVERVVDAVPGVEESAVVGLTRDGSERVYAVAVLAPDTSPGEVARAANRRLADHQKVRDVLVWPGARLPRTEGTRKLMRRAVKTWAEEGGAPAAPAAAGGERSVSSILARIAGSAVDGGTRLDELGLSSLERVELLMTLESELDVAVDERGVAGAATVADLERLVTSSGGASPRPPRRRSPPRAGTRRGRSGSCGGPRSRCGCCP